MSCLIPRILCAFAIVFPICAFADDGKLTGVSPFAVHATVDGPSNHTQIAKLIADVNYKMLRDARVPTAAAVDSAKETNPFFHWKFTARQIRGTGEVLCIARLSIKVRTKNPYNDTPMFGVLMSGFQVEVVDGMDNGKVFFARYVERNTNDVIQSWRSQNPLPGGFALPDNPNGG